MCILAWRLNFTLIRCKHFTFVKHVQILNSKINIFLISLVLVIFVQNIQKPFYNCIFANLTLHLKIIQGVTKKMCIFLRILWLFWTLPILLQRGFSTCLVCVHTLAPRENRARNIFRNSEKHTIFNEHPVP